jgi:hypothetical protein
MSRVKSGRRSLLLSLVAAASGAAFVGGAGLAQADTAGSRTVRVHQNGVYVANLCIKNKSQHNIQRCTGNILKGSVRELDISYNKGDYVEFIVAVVAGHHGYYHLADRDQNCYAAGGSLTPRAYCRVNT